MDALVKYISDGGLFMYPIMAGAIISAMVLVERLLFFAFSASQFGRQSNEFFRLLHTKDEQAALAYLGGRRGVLRNVLVEAMNNRSLPPQRIEQKMESVLLRDLPQYAHYLTLLAAIAGLMPILGLLGTITGMIQTFQVIASQGTNNPQAMAQGISVALITTQAGLVGAAPIVLGHAVLKIRYRRVVDEVHEACSRMLDYVRGVHAQ